MDPAPIVAIVGRPNVGKSTLFNRIIGKKHAIIAEEAGTTRDRIMHKYDFNGYETLLVDTGGLETGKQQNIEEDIQAQAQIAIQDADLILFVVDCLVDLTTDDFTAADILRKSKKPVLLVANKCDHPSLEQNIYNIYELGFGEAIKISAIHKTGIDELIATITLNLKKLKFKKTKVRKKAPESTDISIIGKPNAGKSSLVNALLGAEKIIVSDIAGTTRDSIDTEINYQEDTYNLIDTAGLRRRGKRERGVEKFSALRALNAIERSEVVVLLIDGEKGITKQDCHIAEYALEQEKGLIIAINKIDLLEKEEEERDRIIGKLRRKFIFVPWAPIIFVSAKNKTNIYKILEISKEIMEERKKRVPTPQLNSFLQKITYKHMPASTKIQKPKFFYGSQVEICPPKFLLFFRNPGNLHFSYPRYLENQIREEYGFNGTSINISFKNKSEGEDPRLNHRPPHKSR